MKKLNKLKKPLLTVPLCLAFLVGPIYGEDPPSIGSSYQPCQYYGWREVLCAVDTTGGVYVGGVDNATRPAYNCNNKNLPMMQDTAIVCRDSTSRKGISEGAWYTCKFSRDCLTDQDSTCKDIGGYKSTDGNKTCILDGYKGDT